MKHLLGITAFFVLPVATIWALKWMHDHWFSANEDYELRERYPDDEVPFLDDEFDEPATPAPRRLQ